MNIGIWGLDESEDLLDKLAHDFRRLTADAGQQTMLYTAFDFFVTAYSLVDWVKKHRALTPAEVQALYGEMLIKICADLANGSKHFQLTKPPKTTLTTYSSGPVFQPGVYQKGVFRDDWQAWVELSASEATAADVPRICPVMTLAEKVLAHWERYFGRSP
jgi:hypothetical protein